MQRDPRAPDLFYQRFATRVDLVQIRRTKWLLHRSRENNVTHLEIAHRPVIRGCQRVEFFCNAQRRLADFIIGANVSDENWINRITENHDRIIADFNRIRSAGKRARHHYERISRADQKTKLFQRANLRAQFRNCIAEVALARNRRTCQRVLVFGSF